MTHTYRVLSVAAIALVVLFMACRKTPPPSKNDPFVPHDPTVPVVTTPTTTPTPTLNDLFKELKPTPETIIVPAGVAKTVYAAKGTELNFYPNSFKDENGNVITSGNVTVEITEMYQPGDVISNRASTIANDGMLESGGQVNIDATVAGKTVYANTYGIGFPQAAANPTKQMALYVGNNTSSSNGVTRWKIDDTAKTGRKATGTKWTGSGVTYRPRYMFDSCVKFRLINCDLLHNNPAPRTEINVVMPDSSFDKTNTMVFVALPEIRSVADAEYYFDATNTFNIGSDHYSHKVPTGMAVNIVVMTKKNDIYYYYEHKGGTVVDSMKVTANMRAMTLDSVKIMLSNL